MVMKLKLNCNCCCFCCTQQTSKHNEIMRQRDTSDNKIDVDSNWDMPIDRDATFVDLPEYDLPDHSLEASGSGDSEFTPPTHTVGDGKERNNKTKVAEIPNHRNVS